MLLKSSLGQPIQNLPLQRNIWEPTVAEYGKLVIWLRALHMEPTDSVLLMCVLQVVSSEKMVSPVVMGLTLHSISMSLDMSMAHMAVQLVFGSGRICNGRLDPTGTVSLVLKTVVQVCVLDWWHPRYPHSSNCIRPTHSEEA